jgi:Enoyl-CoA hydratase/carnithine racemase
MSARIETGHHALIVWNDNPDRRNALTADYYAALRDALDRAAADGDIGAVILAGTGDYFSSGGNLNILATRADLPKRDRGREDRGAARRDPRDPRLPRPP